MASRSAVVRSTHPSGSCVRLALCLVLSSELVAVFRFVQNGPCASVTILLGAASTHNVLGRSRDDTWERCRFILRFDSSHHRLCPPSRIAAGVVATFFVVRGSISTFLLNACVCQVRMVILNEMVTHDTPLFARGAARRVPSRASSRNWKNKEMEKY